MFRFWYYNRVNKIDHGDELLDSRAMEIVLFMEKLQPGEYIIYEG